MVVGRKLLVLALAGTLISACGGGGGGSGTSGPILAWVPPSSYTDGTPMNPARDLAWYEIYIRQDASFGPNDKVFASVSPTDTTFDLANLAPLLDPGLKYYVSMRSVGLLGMKSAFSPSYTFSF